MPILSRIKKKFRSETERPEPPKGAHNYVLLILDSCRYDSLVQASCSYINKLGTVEKRYAYATWTAPSHYNLLTGLLPHPSPQNIFASTYYKKDFLKFQQRLNIPDLSFQSMIPQMWMPHYLQSIGYITRAIVSLPVLNPHTPIASGFDSYVMAENHNDLSSIVDSMIFSDDRPTFYLINTGETHYPYAPIHEPESQWPRIHGAHGVFKQISEGRAIRTQDNPQFFNLERLEQLHRRQIHVLETVNASIEKLYDILPSNTFITITSDHGELFGEGGYFGHGPICHEKVLEVPFVEAKIR